MSLLLLPLASLAREALLAFPVLAFFTFTSFAFATLPFSFLLFSSHLLLELERKEFFRVVVRLDEFCVGELPDVRER